MSFETPQNFEGSTSKITEPLPHYVKEESIGFVKTYGTSTDVITDFIEKYARPGRFNDIRKGMSQSMLLVKTKVKPDLNIVPRARKCHLSLREKRQLGLYKLPRKGLKYQEFLKLNELWKQYMMDNLDFFHFANKKGEMNVDDKNWDQVSAQLTKADYHGAQLTVTRSKCPSQVGIQGIVVMDTKNTFRILGKDNIVRSVPKESNVFQFHIDQFKLTMYGKHLCIKPAERTTKKIRNHLSMDL